MFDEKSKADEEAKRQSERAKQRALEDARKQYISRIKNIAQNKEVDVLIKKDAYFSFELGYYKVVYTASYFAFHVITEEHSYHHTHGYSGTVDSSGNINLREDSSSGTYQFYYVVQDEEFTVTEDVLYVKALKKGLRQATKDYEEQLVEEYGCYEGVLERIDLKTRCLKEGSERIKNGRAWFFAFFLSLFTLLGGGMPTLVMLKNIVDLSPADDFRILKFLRDFEMLASCELFVIVSILCSIIAWTIYLIFGFKDISSYKSYKFIDRPLEEEQRKVISNIKTLIVCIGFNFALSIVGIVFIKYFPAGIFLPAIAGSVLTLVEAFHFLFFPFSVGNVANLINVEKSAVEEFAKGNACDRMVAALQSLRKDRIDLNFEEILRAQNKQRAMEEKGKTESAYYD